MNWLALDIGGANLKAADGRGFAVQQPFALWKSPEQLPDALTALLRAASPADRLAVTMTGELCDCFATKREGVMVILAAVEEAAAGRQVCVYLTDGTLVTVEVARARPLEAAASNWHALAAFAARMTEGRTGVLIDVGSTTTDIVPLADGAVAAQGRTDPERLVSRELVYTGVQRSPLCALVDRLPWRGESCAVAQELFATTWDVYLLLGDLPEEPQRCDTADGRSATRRHAQGRLARMICADAEQFDHRDAVQAATAVAAAQQQLVADALGQVLARQRQAPEILITSGSGEFLARRAIEQVDLSASVVSLAERLGPACSQAAASHALAVLAAEKLP